MYRYRKVSSLCSGRPTAVSWHFGYEDYDERRVFANKFDSVFTKLRNKWKISGISFKEPSRTIELCKASCLFFTSFNEYMYLMVNLGTVPINFVQSMKLNVDVVGKKRKVEQDRRTCIWPNIEVLDSSPTIYHFTLDYPIGIVGSHPIHLHQLRQVLRLPSYF